MLVVAHDAGGAEVVSSWLRRYPQGGCRFIVDGPAVSIFKRKLGQVKIEPIEEMEHLLEKSSMLLTGTSWASTLEKLAIRQARKRNINVVSILDNWANYLERFLLDGEQVLPDEIWVCDKYALKLAEETFSNVSIRQIENPYLLDIQDELESCQTSSSPGKEFRNILYTCEPVSAHAFRSKGSDDAFGFTEFEAMALFMSHLRKLSISNSPLNVRIRLHPSEKPDKYDAYIGVESGEINVSKSCNNTLVEDCAWADWVVGINSMALVVALVAGKEVFCCIPGHTRPFGLPHEGIRNFLELSQTD